MSFPKIYLLRHGQTEWNVAGRLQGKLDSVLTSVGHQQALRQAEIIQKIQAEDVKINAFSSPQGRAMATAKLALEGIAASITPEARLSEISAGAWDGHFLKDIECDHAQLFKRARNAFELMFLAPDGEGERAVRARCNAFLAELNAPAVLVTHGATLCVLRGILRGLSFDETLNLEHEQGCVYVIENSIETILR